MPYINVTVGPISVEQKRELISKMVEASMEITGTPEHGNAVVITELPMNALGIGKKTAEEVFGDSK